MKKILLLAFLTAITQSLFAQSVKLGIKAGLNESTTDFGQPFISTSSFLTGFNAGVFANFEIKKLSIEPGIFYTTKGYNDKIVFPQSPTESNDVSAKGKVTYNYLEVPVNVLYNIHLRTSKIFIGGGPYYGLALSGSYNDIVTINGTVNNTTSKLTFGGESGSLKKTDVGVNALAGIAFKTGLLFSFNYGYGLTNVNNTNIASEKIQNRVLSLSVGYVFL